MTGPNEAKLRRVDTVDSATLLDAAGGWTDGADGLREVADKLATAKNNLLAAWEGSPAETASTAFDVLAKSVTDRAEQMDKAAQAVRDAQSALVTASKEPITDLPALKSGLAEDKITEEDREKHAQANVAAREAQAASILKALDGKLAEARDLLGEAAPYDPTSKIDETDRGTSPGTGPTTSGGRVNPGSASGSAAVIGGNVGGTSATADGELIGTVGAGAVGVGLVAGGKTPGGDDTSGGSQLGGIAGSAGVLGGALGGLRNVLGGKTAVAGATPAPGSAPGSVVGGNAARAGSPVLGGQNGQAGQAGAGARTAGSPGSSSTGRGAGSTGRGASSTTGGRGTGAGAGGRGGRGAAGAAGQRDKNDDQTLDHIRFEDDWIDDEDIAPGVIE